MLHLAYESTRLDTVKWAEWKPILMSAARRHKLDVKDLGIGRYLILIAPNRQYSPESPSVTRTNASVTIVKEDIPELGTRPIYFYRKRNWRVATPQEFWGFFTFNKDPNGRTGLHVRVQADGRARIVSDYLSPNAPGGEHKKGVGVHV
jgi:hypothetical protein